MAKTQSPAAVQSDEEEVIARYESMPAKQVSEELRAQGIDPQPTITSVKKLVHDWERSRKK